MSEIKAAAFTLADAREGEKLIVTGTIGEDVTIQALRFGICEGATISIGKNIPGGPVIVVRNQMELAVGRQLARSIEVARQEV